MRSSESTATSVTWDRDGLHVVGGGASEPSTPRPSGALVARDPVMVRTMDLVDATAASEIAVLVVGETGVGKELVARALHERSARRRQGALVTLNCAAMPEALLESELFGHERNAFTGASQAKPGLLESADGGTLVLDEIGELPLNAQAKLLRALESGEFFRVGSVQKRIANVRFVGSTNRDLAALAAEGRFRKDLFFRIAGMTIRVPALRERPADIAPLAAHLLEQESTRNGRSAPTLGGGAMRKLLSHDWPGNVRELRNVMARVLLLCSKDRIEAEHVVFDALEEPRPARASAPPGKGVSGSRLMRLDATTERSLIEQALATTGGNQTKAAALLGISRRSLLNRLDAYGFERPRRGRDADVEESCEEE